MSKPTIVAQITDLHIKAPGELAYNKVDTAKALERCVAELNALDPRPDLVVISGDLVDTPTPGEYEHLWRLLAPLKIPFIGVPGNHDARDMMRAAFPDFAYAHASARSIRRGRWGRWMSSCWTPMWRANPMARWKPRR